MGGMSWWIQKHMSEGQRGSISLPFPACLWLVKVECAERRLQQPSAGTATSTAPKLEWLLFLGAVDERHYFA